MKPRTEVALEERDEVGGEGREHLLQDADVWTDVWPKSKEKNAKDSIKLKKSEVRYKQCDGYTGVLFFSLGSILVPQPRIEPVIPAVEVRVLTPGSQERLHKGPLCFSLYLSVVFDTFQDKNY